MENYAYNENLSVPSILTFADYRKFLEVAVPAFQAANRLSLRRFVANCGLSSTSFLQAVIKSQKNILPSTATRIAQALGMRDHEVKYFVFLVALNQAKTAPEVRSAHNTLLQYRRSLDKKVIANAQSVLFSRPEIIILFELIRESDDADELFSRAAFLGLSQIEFSTVLKDLENEGFISKREKSILKKTHYLDSQSIQTDQSLMTYHQNALRFLISLLEKSALGLSYFTALALTEVELRDVETDLRRIINRLPLRKSHSQFDAPTYVLSLHLRRSSAAE